MLSMDYKSGLESEAEVYQGYVTLQSLKQGKYLQMYIY